MVWDRNPARGTATIGRHSAFHPQAEPLAALVETAMEPRVRILFGVASYRRNLDRSASLALSILAAEKLSMTTKISLFICAHFVAFAALLPLMR